MQSSDAQSPSRNPFRRRGLRELSAILIAASSLGLANRVLGAGDATNAPADAVTAPTDPVLGLMLEKGMITEDEAAKVQAQADALRTNMAAQFARENASKWKISSGIKDMEIFGDVRSRYEDRLERDPSGGKIDLQRFRYAVRFGLRGDAFDDFYYGLRLETSSNPRSTWVTMGTSSPDPYGKSAAGIDIGQAYIGWQYGSWLDLTVGKMPNPLYTSSMVWSSSINPEGVAEHFKYAVGPVSFFANFAQFLYQDENPNDASSGLGVNGGLGQTSDNVYQVAWQAGLNYQITTNISAKVAATIYQYFGLQQSSANQALSPYLGDPYVGEGSYAGVGSANLVNGFSGYGTSSSLVGDYSSGYPNNQVGLDHLTVLEVPFEVNFKIKSLNARVFGDFAYNLDGEARAQAAATGYAAYLDSVTGGASIKAFSPQTDDVKAYQIGVALGNKDSLGLVNGSTVKKHAWEVRTYWQHVEQYSLDPNLLDLDYFAGAENLQGMYAAVAYGFSDNFIGTIRYGYASRINSLLGTGGTGTDIPQINPIDNIELFQADLTFKF
jgi:hypothetical protein